MHTDTSENAVRLIKPKRKRCGFFENSEVAALFDFVQAFGYVLYFGMIRYRHAAKFIVSVFVCDIGVISDFFLGLVDHQNLAYCFF